MAEVRRHPPVLDYAPPRRPRRPSWDGRWLERGLDVVLALLGMSALAALVIVGRLMVVLTTSPGRLFGLQW